MASSEGTPSSAANIASIKFSLDDFVEYKGVTLMAVQPPEIIEALKDWETRPDDVYIVTYPKSGTHWILEIVSLIMYGVDIEKIDRSHMVYGLDLTLAHNVDGLATITPGYEAISKWESPRVIPTHILEEFCPEQIKKSKDLRRSVSRVADFLERPLSDEQLDKMVELTEMEGMRKTYQQIEDKMGEKGKLYTRLFGQLPYLGKGKVGGWKEKFTVAENEYFDKIYEENMADSGVEFQFEL